MSFDDRYFPFPDDDVPDHFDLFVGPASCSRRRILMGMVRGSAKRHAVLEIADWEFAAGAFEQLVIEAVGEVLERVSPPPGIVCLRLTCIDDVLGIDMDAVLAHLGDCYPHVEFWMLRHSPVSREWRGRPTGPRPEWARPRYEGGRFGHFAHTDSRGI